MTSKARNIGDGLDDRKGGCRNEVSEEKHNEEKNTTERVVKNQKGEANGHKFSENKEQGFRKTSLHPFQNETLRRL